LVAIVRSSDSNGCRGRRSGGDCGCPSACGDRREDFGRTRWPRTVVHERLYDRSACRRVLVQCRNPRPLRNRVPRSTEDGTDGETDDERIAIRLLVDELSCRDTASDHQNESAPTLLQVIDANWDESNDRHTIPIVVHSKAKSAAASRWPVPLVPIGFPASKLCDLQLVTGTHRTHAAETPEVGNYCSARAIHYLGRCPTRRHPFCFMGRLRSKRSLALTRAAVLVPRLCVA
jgi:hypothetical protein